MYTFFSFFYFPYSLFDFHWELLSVLRLRLYEITFGLDFTCLELHTIEHRSFNLVVQAC